MRRGPRSPIPRNPVPTGSGQGRLRVAFLYEDDDVVVVDKPVGLPVISPESSRAKSLYDIVTARIRATNPRGRAAVVHRIDRDTSGIVVFAKHADMKRRLMGNWNELVTERRYIALVEGSPAGESGELVSYLVENKAGTVYETGSAQRGAMRAVTRWKLLKAGVRYSLVELDLETGRKHQIRVQLAGMGHPVAGDSRYGARTDPLGRLCLHASRIVFRTSDGGEPFAFESPPPPGFIRAVR